ncbi:MAG: phenylalanine--tRNA ligase subunit beta [Halobacteriales archaeon]
MPVVDIDTDELRTLTGHGDKSDDELKSDLFALGLEFEGETDDGELRFEFEPDRLDRLSVEGVARSLRYQYGDDRGVHVPATNDPEWTITVEGVPAERPYVTGAVIRGLDLDEAALESLIQLQEKLHATMGRAREKGAIGVHDLAMLKGAPATGGERSVRYTGIDPEGDTFVPLDADREMTPADVLAEHPIGGEYTHLVADYERMPAIYDDLGLFSFPPVINGRRTEVTADSRELFVEMTGTDQWTIDRMLNIVCYALGARGGRIEAVRVEYDDREVVRPDLTVEEKEVEHRRLERALGIDLGTEAVVDLLERSGLDAEPRETGDGTAYRVGIPPYRVDVLHPIDLVDDVGRAYGFNELAPRYPDVSTIGGRHGRSRLERAVREFLAGAGFEDLLNFHLIAREENFDRMGIEPGTDVVGGGDPVVIEEPYSEAYGIVRTWALPSVLMVLENNTHRTYPQDVAEVGFAAERDGAEPTHVAERRTVAGALARADASYEDAKARLAALCRRFGADLETPATDHPTFLGGRAAAIEIDGEAVGVVGEVHPEVLVAHDLELPVAAFEFELDALG